MRLEIGKQISAFSCLRTAENSSQSSSTAHKPITSQQFVHDERIYELYSEE